MTAIPGDGTRASVGLNGFSVAWFGMVMGLAGVTLAWQRLEGLLGWTWGASAVMRFVAAAVFTLLSGLYLLKWLRYPGSVRAEVGHPVTLHLFATITVSLILLGMAYAPDTRLVSLGLWMAGTVAHVGLTLYVVGLWINDPRFEIEHMNPAWFIPAVGNILVPIAGVGHGWVELSWFCFSIGLVFWFALFTIVLYRVIFHDPIPERLVPTMFILIAPPSVGLVSYVALTGELDAFARILYHIALFFTLLLVTQIPRYSRLPFSLAWWAYSFPLAAVTVASAEYHARSAEPLSLALAVILCLGLSSLVAALIARTAAAVIRGERALRET